MRMPIRARFTRQNNIINFKIALMGIVMTCVGWYAHFIGIYQGIGYKFLLNRRKTVF